jgi:hypothetical protein
MKRGIGAIPQNLIIKSGGYTYYPLNQFEIDGTVAVELYRQDSDGDKTRVFVFKGTKNELSEFKKRYPVRTIKQSFYKAKRYPYESPEKGELERLTPAAIKRLYNKVDVDVDPIKRLHKLAESLSAEAANFNKKIKTGGTLTPNELRAAGKIIPKYNTKFNRNVITSAPKKSAERSKMVKSFIKENSLTKKELKSIKNTRDAKPAVKKLVVKKPAAVKKATTKKSPLRQTGSSNTKFDKLVQAMKPGKRTSASGNVYYERRADRTDKGKKL